jgi:endonuclease/exonuclease/phosphatase (EEP) superfamily protein YafD
MLRSRQNPIARPLVFGTALVSLATLLAFGGRWSWACELLVNFRLHFALLFVVAIVLAVAIRFWSVAAIAVLGVALNVWPMSGALFGAGAPVVSNARAVRVVEFNVNIANDDLAGIAAYVESLKADVAVLAEVSPRKADRLAALLPGLPHVYAAQKDGVWGVMILSRWPLLDPRPANLGDVPPVARVDLDLGDRKLRLYGAHLNWPVLPATADIRNKQLRALGRELAQCAFACVAVGDFNVTPWSSHFRDVLENPGIHDCAAGRGFLGTWAAGFPAPLRIRIDQCLAAGAVSVADLRVGRGVGSDHLATINDLLIGAP